MLITACSSRFLTLMAKWKLCFVLLLPITVWCDSEETKVKTIGREADLTPICSNATQRIITLIVCKISTEEGKNCDLLYEYGKDFEHNCDPRFTLIVVNQTVFLHLTSLTPADSGNYSCECSHPKETHIIHLNITVEEVEDASSPSQKQTPSALIGAAVVIPIIAVFFGFIYRRIRHRRKPEPLRRLPNTESETIEPYSTFIQRDNELYSTTRVNVCSTNNSNMSTREDPHSGKFL